MDITGCNTASRKIVAKKVDAVFEDAFGGGVGYRCAYNRNQNEEKLTEFYHGVQVSVGDGRGGGRLCADLVLCLPAGCTDKARQRSLGYNPKGGFELKVR